MNKSKQEMHVNADITHNVHVIVGKPLPDGKLQVSTDRLFKNTATRLMTQSIAEFLAGSEHSYNRQHGRPNYMSFGTMGIKKQPNLVTITEENRDTYLEEHFTDRVFENPEDRTRPWYESTSLALTDTCGASDVDSEGYNKHFWDTRYCWGSPTQHGLNDPPVYQGELCTEYDNPYNDYQIVRSPILRADVATDCPQDLEYGKDGYASTVIFYGYASVKWVNDLLEPVEWIEETDPDTGKKSKRAIPFGPQLSRMAISEFGLYEKTNKDPHGMYTLFAGFRVPEIKDIVYVSKDEVVLVEWRVTVRALMPNEVVSATDNTGKRIMGISLDAHVQSKIPGDPNSYVQMSGTVLGDPGVSQSITWEVTQEHDPSTTIDANGLLTVTPSETHDAIYVTGSSTINPDVNATVAMLTGLLTDYVYGLAISTDIVDQFNINFTGQVLYKGTVNTTVDWTIESADQGVPLNPGTTISKDAYGTAHLVISQQEEVRKIKVIAKSNHNNNIVSAAAVIRIGQTEGAYVISDFTILT